MSRLFFDYDPETRQTEFFHYDEMEATFTIETVEDVEPIIEANKKLYNEGDGFNAARDGRRIATIPNIIIDKWKREYGIDVFDKNHAQGVRRLLNDPDWRFLRTAPGCF